MSFNIVIKADSAQAEANVKKVGEALKLTEQAATKAQAAIVDGMKQGSTSADKMKASVGGLADQAKREADMLEKIKGPMREYLGNSAALDVLYKKNAISAKEYTDQVERLNQSISKSPKSGGATLAGGGEEHHGIEVEGSFRSSIASRFGEAGNLAGGMAGGALEAAGVVALGAEVVHLGDEYTNLANKAMRFVDATHSANDILNEQYGLSKELHGSLEQVGEIYSAVREGTDDLNMSHRDQIALTKALSMEVQLSGKSLDSAGGMMQKLSFAMESGILGGRELRQIFREYPAIMHTLEDSMGKTSKELIAMANHGTLAPRAIADALIQAEPKIAEAHEKLREGFDVTMKHMSDFATLKIGGFIEVDEWAQKIRDMNDPVKQATLSIEKLTEDLKSQSGPFGEANRAAAKYNAELAETARIARLDTWGTQIDPVKSLNELIKVGTTEWDRLAKKVHEHSTAMSEEQKVLQEIRGPQEELDKKLVALEVLAAKGKISLDDYTDALIKWGVAASRTSQLQVDLGGLKHATAGLSDIEGIKKWAEETSKQLATEAKKQETEKNHRLTEGFKLEVESYKKHVEEIRNVLKPLEDAFVTLAKTGKFEWQTMLDSMEQMLIQKLSDAAFQQIAGMIASSFGGGGGVLDYVINGQHTGVPLYGGAHATGGSYTVPGNGPADSQNVLFRLTPGEHVQFTPPGQPSAPAASSSPTVVQIHNHTDPNELLGIVDSPGGERVIMNVIRRNAAAIRSYTGGR